MKLAEVFTQLAYGEFSQLALGTMVEGELDASNYPALISHVNLGLTALYKRFKLKEGRSAFPLVGGTYVYKLGISDLTKMEQILTAEGVELGLNNYADQYGCFTTSMDTVRVSRDIVDGHPDLPEKYKTSELTVVYRANHPRVIWETGFDPEAVELELPYSHLEALLYFVASRAHNPIGMVNEFNAGNNWAMKYENECLRLKESGLEINEGNSEESRLQRNGWV